MRRAPSSRTIDWTQKKLATRAPARHRLDPVQAGGGIEQQMAGRQLDRLRAEIVLDHQLAAVIGVRILEEERRRKVAADAELAAAVDAHRIVDMGAERLAALVAVEQRREDLERQRRGDEQGRAAERVEHEPPASRAAALSSGSCWLRLASADWWPEVALPSIHSPASTIARTRATPSVSSRSGMASIMARGPSALRSCRTGSAPPSAPRPGVAQPPVIAPVVAFTLLRMLVK